eukprot:COSAG02_NODE_1355_length_13099_cov_10.562923_4_plen_387_part_00
MAAATGLSCDALAPGGCSNGVCDACCSAVMHYANASSAAVVTALCEACVIHQCRRFDCADPTAGCTQQCVEHCWDESSSAPCLRDCVSCRGVWLAVAVAIPFVGRLGVDYLKNKLTERLRAWLQRNFACFRPRAGPVTVALLDSFSASVAAPDGVAAAAEPFTAERLFNGDKAGLWAEACIAGNLSTCGAAAQAAGKLLGWHLAQPVGYFVVYGCAVSAGDLDGLQRWLGGFVLLREVLYLLAVVVCAWVNPAFLLVDVAASVRSDGSGVDGGYRFLAMYVVAPEKYVLSALVPDGPLIFFGFLLGLLLDLCGLGALGAGLAAGDLPPALAVGYTVTALGALVATGYSVVNSICGYSEIDILIFALICTACILAAFFVPFVLTLWL